MPHGITLLFFLNGKPISPHNRLLFSLSKHPKLSIEILYIESGDNPEVWDWIADIIKEKKAANVINLFGYTGAATVSAALAGANVCHVDASKGSVSWCKENMQLSKVPDGKVRLIIEDCMKYIQREERRNKKYDGIIMDPPSFGLITFAAFFSFIISAIQSQFAACSGKSPVCLNPVGCTFNTILL